MKLRKKSCLQQNKGETLIVAILIMLVVMMVTASILAAAYALFQTVNGQELQTQCHLLAMDVSDILEQQITEAMDLNAEGEEMTAEEFKSQMTAPSGGICQIQQKNALWYYLRCNILQTTWPWYDVEDLKHLELHSWQNYNLNVSDLTGSVSRPLGEYDVKVTMYWTDDDAGAKINTSNPRPHEYYSPRLVVMVSCSVGRYESIVTTEYLLNIDRFANPQPAAGEPADYVMTTGYQTGIYWQENWEFDRYNRR